MLEINYCIQSENTKLFFLREVLILNLNQFTLKVIRFMVSYLFQCIMKFRKLMIVGNLSQQFYLTHLSLNDSEFTAALP